MIRRLAVAVTVVAAVMCALPAQAAPKVQKYYLGNTGAPQNNACTQALSLLKAPTPDNECSSAYYGYGGSGASLEDESYSTGKGTSLKLDTSRPVTGTIYINSVPPLTGTPVKSAPGAGKATLTVKVGTTTLGSVTVEGPVTTAAVKKDFSFALPASLKNKIATKVTALVEWTDAVGIMVVSYTDPSASVVNIPIK